jgi:hypothetical protein
MLSWQPVLGLSTKESCRQPTSHAASDKHHTAVWLCCRPRPGWEQLRHYLSGLADLEACGQKKDRWAGPWYLRTADCMRPYSVCEPT